MMRLKISTSTRWLLIFVLVIAAMGTLSFIGCFGEFLDIDSWFGHHGGSLCPLGEDVNWLDEHRFQSGHQKIFSDPAFP